MNKELPDLEVVYQRKLYEAAIDNKPPARREVESGHYYNAAFDGVDYGKVAYERFRELPATPKDAASWDRLKGAERNEWRAIVEPVVERVRAEKSRPSIVADDETIERFAVIVGENGGESLSSAEMERITKAVIASITDTTKPTKPAMKAAKETRKMCSGQATKRQLAATYTCCDKAGQYNGYGSDGPTLFECPNDCSCHD